MVDWILHKGTILLNLMDGNLYRPKSIELFQQKDKNEFVIGDHAYEPLSSLNIRFSSLAANVKVEFSFNEHISLELFYTKNEIKSYVAKYNNTFNDYIIHDNTWKYIDGTADVINNFLEEEEINPSDLTYQQYVQLLRELSEYGIEVLDNVVISVKDLADSNQFLLPTGLKANLYPYQLSGAKWLDFMIRNKCGCILGDEMGLGKTLQIIALMGLIKERKDNSHFLVVCPVSLLENWRREINKFYPSLSVNIHYGINRTGDYRVLMDYDVNIMSYSCSITDTGLLTLTHWDLLVIDEAQNIKNPKAKRTKAVKRINCDVPIAVTGTPFENHMTDIWSLIDFAIPGFLGNLSHFETDFSDDLVSAKKLEKIISPLILKRKVKDVAKDLPERIDIPQPIIMSFEEAALYENSRNYEDPHKELKSMQLAKIQRLRTFCTHPCVYNEDLLDEDPMSNSTKYKRLCEISEEVFHSNEKLIIFTSFRRMIDLICSDFNNRFGVYTNYIDGSVEASRRQFIVDEFSSIVGPGVLVLNPRAAGTGLNITCANHAVHYNLEWNPAIEDQASARIFRRGQEKTVFIYRLFYVDTIEDIINEKIQSKRLLSENAVIGNTGALTEREYLIKALTASPLKA